MKPINISLLNEKRTNRDPNPLKGVGGRSLFEFNIHIYRSIEKDHVSRPSKARTGLVFFSFTLGVNFFLAQTTSLLLIKKFYIKVNTLLFKSTNTLTIESRNYNILSLQKKVRL